MQKRIPEGKKYVSFYITENVRSSIQMLIEITDLPKTRIYNKAYQYFLEKRDQTIDPRILIKKRTDPQYIRRDVLETDYIKMEYYLKMKELSEKNKCSVACVIYAALVEYITIFSMRIVR
ncbi:MAG: hypothetical protein Q4B85_13585 [Lachnospiraceae bacterium]|nr:hypothetical protein [Lachnospiraceae bacterium]